MVKTERLTAIMLEGSEFFEYISERDTTQSEKVWIDSVMVPVMLERPSMYHTFWIGIDHIRELIVCEFCFKGDPDSNGAVEIGYNTIPVFRNMGYMTEMLELMIGVAKDTPEIRYLTAYVDPTNIYSQLILMRNKFKPVRGIWRKNVKDGMD